MSAALPFASSCCTPDCPDEISVQVPGPKGDACEPCADGADGQPAWTTIVGNFTMPAELGSANQEVLSSAWIGLNQILYLAGAGYLKATAIPDATHVTLKNLEDAGTDAYLDNVAPATVIPSGSKLCAGGLQGPSAPALGGELLAANNLNDVVNVGTSRNNLGLGSIATQNANAVAVSGGTVAGIVDLAVADGGTGASDALNARANLGLVITVNVQAQDAQLQAIADLTPAANQLPYFTSLTTAGVTDITAAGRALIDDADATAQRATLSVLPKQGLLGSLIGANFNSTADQAITIASAKYVIRRIVVVNASVNLNTAAGGIYGAAAKSAPIAVAAAQVYSALTAATKFVDLTLTALCGTDVFTQATLYLSLTTAQGVAATADVFIFGDVVV